MQNLMATAMIAAYSQAQSYAPYGTQQNFNQGWGTMGSAGNPVPVTNFRRRPSPRQPGIMISNSANSCCPSACPGVQNRSCCQACPKRCNSPPVQMAPCAVSSTNCTRTVISWQTPNTCSPITQMDLECKDAMDQFRAMPTIVGTYLQWPIENDHLRRAPFNLLDGDQIVCRIRSLSKCGGSPWSQNSAPVTLTSCKKAVQAEVRRPEPAACRPSCQQYGCGGRCNGITWSNTANYWDNIYSKAKQAPQAGCCGNRLTAPMCNCQQAAPQVQLAAPVVQMCTNEYVTNEPSTKTVMQMSSQQKTIKKVKMVTIQKQVASTETRQRMVNRTQFRNVRKSRPVKRAVQRTRQRMVSKHVLGQPRPVPMAVQESSCGCYQQRCGCQGQLNCNCCQPACSCAPVQQVQMQRSVEVIQVPESYTETVHVDDVEYYDDTEQFTVQVPESYEHPITVTVNVEEPQECEETITVQIPVEVQVPTTIQKRVSVQEPCSQVTGSVVNSTPVQTQLSSQTVTAGGNYGYKNYASTSIPTIMVKSSGASVQSGNYVQNNQASSDIPTIMVKSSVSGATEPRAPTVVKSAQWNSDVGSQKEPRLITMEELKAMQKKEGVTVQWDDLPNAKL